MNHKKISFWVIIILLIILLPMTIFSTIMHFKNSKSSIINPNHEFFYNGSLYFYNGDELLGTYSCKHPDGYCGYAESINEEGYSLDELENKLNSKISVVKNRYAFLVDSEAASLTDNPVILYDLVNNTILSQYNIVKNYSVGIEDDLFIVKNTEGLYGVIGIGDIINIRIPFQYEYIGIANILSENNKISSNIFAVKKDNQWQLIDASGATYTDKIADEIVSYDGNNIIIKKADKMNLINYDQKPILEGYNYINFYNGYLAIIDEQYNFYLYDMLANNPVSDKYLVTSIDDVELSRDDSNIIITINGEEKETIAIA